MSDTETTPEADVGEATANLPVPVGQQPAGGVKDFVREHPVLVVAGGLAVGALAAALIPRRNREKVAKGANHFAEAATAAGIALGKHLLDRAETASDELRRHGGQIAGKVEELGGAARDQAGRILAPAEKAASGTAQRIVELASEINARIRR